MSPENFLFRLVTGRRWRLFRHVLLMGLLALVFLRPGVGLQVELGEASPVSQFSLNLLFLLLLLSAIYVNLYVLVPRFLGQGRIWVYLAQLLGMVALLFGVLWLFDRYYLTGPGSSGHTDLSLADFPAFGFLMLLVLGAFSAARLFQLWMHGSHRLLQLEKMRLQTELDSLRSHLNPHFLLNTLNNAHVLVRRDAARGSDVLLRLSGLLRYQLYENTRDKVLLSQEIQFLTDLLELEKIRHEAFAYRLHTEGETGGCLVPSHLFIPFVENAIKHGVDLYGRVEIRLSFLAGADRIRFCCTNTRPAQPLPLPAGGLGLPNVRRRLELLYGEAFELVVTDTPEHYNVILDIPYEVHPH